MVKMIKDVTVTLTEVTSEELVDIENIENYTTSIVEIYNYLASNKKYKEKVKEILLKNNVEFLVD